MLVYKDVFTGDEMIGDSYDLKLIDDVVYEADCSMVEVGVGEINIGGNASAEEADEGTDDQAEKVNNVVYSFKLAPTSFDKKSYMTYIKGYMKKVKAHLQETNPDRIPIFEKGIASFVKKVLGNFNDYEFYTGESMNPDGMVALLNYREDGTTPYFSFIKDALKEEKFVCLRLCFLLPLLTIDSKLPAFLHIHIKHSDRVQHLVYVKNPLDYRTVNSFLQPHCGHFPARGHYPLSLHSTACLFLVCCF